MISVGLASDYREYRVYGGIWRVRNWGGRGLVSDYCRISVGLPRIPSVRWDLGVRNWGVGD